MNTIHRQTGLYLTLVICFGLISGCNTKPGNETLRNRAVVAASRQQYAEAAEHYRQAIEQNPTDWRAHIGQGKAYMKLKQWPDAQLAMERALTLRPDHKQTPKILDDIAECLFRQSRRNDLYLHLQNAASTYVTSYDFLRQANYMTKIGDIDSAKLAYRKAAHFAKPDDVRPYLARAAFYETIGDQESAIISLRQAYGIRPEEPHIGSRLRRYGIVPGPTIALPPDSDPLPEEQVIGVTEMPKPEVQVFELPKFPKQKPAPEDSAEVVVEEVDASVGDGGSEQTPTADEPVLIELPTASEPE